MPRALLVSLLVMLVMPVTAAATTYTVTTTADSNDPTCTPALCSLRDAINHSVSGDKVVVPAGTYTLSLGVLAIGASHDLTIVGAGASSTTVDANQTSGVFTVAAQDNVTLS